MTPHPRTRGFPGYKARKSALLLLLCMLLAACQNDALSLLGGANPLLARLTAKSRAELLAMDGRARYASSYRYFLTETLNLARGAEEGSDARVQAAGRRIVAHLVMMLGAVEDPKVEKEIVSSIRSFIRLAESLLLGSRDRWKGVKVRNLRDQYALSLDPGRVKAYSKSPAPPALEATKAHGKILKKRTETVLEGGKEVTRYFVTVRISGDEVREIPVTEKEYRSLIIGSHYPKKVTR